MKEQIVPIVAAGLGGALTLFVVWTANSLRVRASLPRRVERLEAIAARQLETLDVQTDGIIAIAEAVSGKQCNGNVDSALISMRADKDKTRAFMAESVAGRRTA